jgi:DNA replication initiation complex subunit (GINS family)
MPDHYSLLLDWRRAETSARGLARLPHDFFEATQAYLAEARRVYESELRENPSGKKGEVARQTYHRASQIARDIVDARMSKVLSQAFQASIGGGRDLPNALAEERALFDAMTDTLRKHRSTVAPYLEATGPSSAVPPAAPAPMPVRAEAPTAARPSTAPVVLVRILQDAPAVETGGETLHLRKEDVLSLPAPTAQILIDGKVAERIERAEPPAAT